MRGTISKRHLLSLLFVFTAGMANAQDRVLLGASTSLVGFGPVVVHTTKYKTFDYLGGYAPGSNPATTPFANINWTSSKTLAGPGSDQFKIEYDPPFGMLPTKSLWIGGGGKLEVDAWCRPTRKGRHVANFSPNIVRGLIDTKIFPIKLICTGIGKTPNRNGISVTTGYQNNPLEFPKTPLKTNVQKRVLISNFTERTVTIKVNWDRKSPWYEINGNRLKPIGYWGLKLLNPITRKLAPGANMYVNIDFQPRVAGIYKGVIMVTIDGKDARFLYVEGKG